jgi:hypothetical protein
MTSNCKSSMDKDNSEKLLPPIDYFALLEVYLRADQVWGPLFAPWCPDCGKAMRYRRCRHCGKHWALDEC